MAGNDENSDLKIRHLEWLIISRAKNQQCTLDLYKTINRYETLLEADPDKFYVQQALASACFSLWRAAFLSDVTRDAGPTIEKTKEFLRNIIANNMIGFTQDLQSNHFTFRYYMGNAGDQLSYLITHHKDKHIVRIDIGQPTDQPAMEYWDMLQTSLSAAVTNFDQYLNEQEQLNKSAGRRN